jgi:hypothetical protein
MISLAGMNGGEQRRLRLPRSGHPRRDRKRYGSRIDATVNGLTPGFPERIVSSIIEGMRRRLRLFAHATA